MGEWPLGPFADTMDGQVARAAGEMAFVIRAHRRSREWTQTGLASRAGVTRQTVSSFERGEFIPQLESVVRMLVALEQQPRLTLYQETYDNEALRLLGVSPDNPA